MKQAILLHGTGGNDSDYFWFADTKLHLGALGYSVWWPLLPHTEAPDLAETKAYVVNNLPKIDSESVVICHSSACPLFLDILQTEDMQVGTLILVSGYYQAIGGQANSMLPANGFDWEAIKPKAGRITLINSDNDPWGCNDQQARPAANSLGATFVFAKGEGHMGSGTYNQPYREFPLLKSLLHASGGPELVSVVDEHDVPLRPKPRDELDTTDIVRIAVLWIEDGQGNVLLQQRSLNKKIGPGQWGPAVAGTVEAHESYLTNIIKEAEEEIGLTLEAPEEVSKRLLRETDAKYGRMLMFFKTLSNRPAESFTVQPDEVAQLKWVPKPALLQDAAAHPENYVPSAVFWKELFS